MLLHQLLKHTFTTVTEYINDTDGDGVCDELEIGGCTDSEHVTTAQLQLMTMVLVNTFHVLVVQTVQRVTTTLTLSLRMDHACTLLNSMIVMATA